MSFAIIETGGKQYKVSASNILKVEKLDIKKGNKVEFKKVLLVNDDKTVEIGDPTVSGAIVEGMLLDNIKDRKVIVFKKDEDRILENVTGIGSLYPRFRLLR